MRAATGPSSALVPRPRVRLSGVRSSTVGGRRLTVTVAAANAEMPEESSSSLTASDSGGESTAPAKSVWYGRALLIFVAAAYGSLSVAFKFVYSLPGPPSAGTIGAVRGVMAAICFIPMLLKVREGSSGTHRSPGCLLVPYHRTVRGKKT